ncbi:MAG: hypothetical protein JJU45_16800 [Acidimicrobiia bacterium]|nr:hypothetical protein [Acidimicrobiia bacterium]
MAKTRCPQCGAMNDADTAKCRLCGYDLTGVVQEILPQKGARTATKSRSGLSGAFGIGILAVLLLGTVAVIMGAPGSETVTGALRSLPFVQPASDDGWQRFTDEEGGFSAELPGTATQTSDSFALVEGGETTVWTGRVADEIELTITYGALEPAFVEAEPSEVLRVNAVADAWVASLGGRERTRDERTVYGQRGLDLSLADLQLDGERANGRTIVWDDGDEFWSVTVVTTRSGADSQFDRVLRSLSFN